MRAANPRISCRRPDSARSLRAARASTGPSPCAAAQQRSCLLVTPSAAKARGTVLVARPIVATALPAPCAGTPAQRGVAWPRVLLERGAPRPHCSRPAHWLQLRCCPARRAGRVALKYGGSPARARVRRSCSCSSTLHCTLAAPVAAAQHAASAARCFTRPCSRRLFRESRIRVRPAAPRAPRRSRAARAGPFDFAAASLVRARSPRARSSCVFLARPGCAPSARVLLRRIGLLSASSGRRRNAASAQPHAGPRCHGRRSDGTTSPAAQGAAGHRLRTSVRAVSKVGAMSRKARPRAAVRADRVHQRTVPHRVRGVCSPVSGSRISSTLPARI